MSSQQPSRRPAWPVILLLLVSVAGMIAFTPWRERLLGLFVHADRLQELVERLGPAGPLAVILLQAAQVLLAPVPGQVLGLASGALFGPWLGTLYSMLGLLLGSYLAVWLVRRWGRPLVERLVDPQSLARVDRLSRRLGAPLLFLVFLVPFLPDDAILLVAGLTEIPTAVILLAALFGRLPGLLVSAFIGESAMQLTPVQWAGVIVAAIIVAVPIYVWREPLQHRVWSLVERFSGRRPDVAPDATPDDRNESRA